MMFDKAEIDFMESLGVNIDFENLSDNMLVEIEVGVWKMVTKYSFTCAVCGKEYTVNGYWWNQWVMHHWIDYRYLIHSFIHHRRKLKIRAILYILKMTFLWVSLIALQIIDILLQPLRWIL